MSTPVQLVPETAPLPLVRDQLLELNITSLAVVDAGDHSRLVGVITRTDLFRVGSYQLRMAIGSLVLPEVAVAEVMTPDPICVDELATIAHTAGILVENRINRVFVVGSAGLAGVISSRDIMRVIANSGMDSPLSQIMSSPVKSVEASRPLAEGINLMTNANISGVVVTVDGKPKGVLTHEEAIAAAEHPVGVTVADLFSPAILILPQETALHVAAGNAASQDIRRIVVSHGDEVVGIVSGVDFCRIAAAN